MNTAINPDARRSGPRGHGRRRPLVASGPTGTIARAGGRRDRAGRRRRPGAPGRSALAFARPGARRTLAGRRRQRQPPARVLLRRDRRRVVEDDRRRPDLARGLRQVLQELVGRRRRGLASRIRTSSTSAWARPSCAAMSCRATASTSRPTPARRGRTSGSRRRRAIARIRVHPTNPDIVYVAALGDPYGPNPERGVFKSSDGGKTWSRVLFRDDKTGAVDLSMDREEPGRLVRRRSGRSSARRIRSRAADRAAGSSRRPTAAGPGPR